MTATERQQLDHIRLARSRSVGPVTFQKLLEQYGDTSSALDALLDGPQAGKVCSLETAEAELTAAQRLGAGLFCLGFAPYPARLAAIPGAPPILYYKGNPALLDARIAAIVGARNASGGGLKLTRLLAEKLGQEGVVIASGLARGIDAAAHGAALNTGTIACLAGGLDVIYPHENSKLYHQILENGLLVSEMPARTKPQARHFPRRNRIISGVSDGVIVVEAAARSGSLITARFAAEQGRDLFAVPGSPLDPRSAGGNRLIKDGAVLVRDAEDVLDELQFAIRPMPAICKKRSQAKKVEIPERPHRQTARKQNTNSLLSLLSPSPIHIDEIITLTGCAADQIVAELQLLELDGKVARHSGARFSRIV